MDISYAIKDLPTGKARLFNYDSFLNILNLQYHIIIASEGLLKAALQEPLDADLRQYYTSHLNEELHHAEWLYDDIKSTGIPPSPINWDAAKIAGMQYYLIKHINPILLLGYIAYLETRPMQIEQLEVLEGRYGKELLRTVRYHAEDDPKHGGDVLELIQSYPDFHSLIYQNARETASMFINIYSDME